LSDEALAKHKTSQKRCEQLPRELVHAAGLVNTPDRVTLTVRDHAGTEREVNVETDSKVTDIWNTLPAPASWITSASTLPAPPLYVQHMEKAHWFECLADRKTVYFQFNGVRARKSTNAADVHFMRPLALAATCRRSTTPSRDHNVCLY
jgi:hypothetical protein